MRTLAPFAADRENRSMKGAVKTNISPPTGARTENASWQPAPFRGADLFSGFTRVSVVHHNVVLSAETEKRRGGDECRP